MVAALNHLEDPMAQNPIAKSLRSPHLAQRRLPTREDKAVKERRREDLTLQEQIEDIADRFSETLDYLRENEE